MCFDCKGLCPHPCFMPRRLVTFSLLSNWFKNYLPNEVLLAPFLYSSNVLRMLTKICNLCVHMYTYIFMYVDFCHSNLRSTNFFPLNNGSLLLHPLEQQRILWRQNSREQDLWYKRHIKALYLNHE